MSNPYGPPSGPQPQQPYGQPPGYGPPSGPQPQPYGAPPNPQSGPMPQQMPPYGQQPMSGPMVAVPGVPAEWGSRALGFLVDWAISAGSMLVAIIVAAIFFVAGGANDNAVLGVIGGLIYIVGILATVTIGIWNTCYRRGTTGKTIGQKVAKIKTIGEEHGQPIGFGNAFLRQLCHIVDSLPLNIGYLAPLWEPKKQTWADKIMRTVVVRADDQMPGDPMTGYGQRGQPGQMGYPGSPQPGQMPPQPGQVPPGYGPPQQW